MKKEEFLRIASMLADEFQTVPLLYGSLGLEQRLMKDLKADDIDILISERILNHAWNRLVACMQQLGYTLYDEHEHAFCREGISAAFASVENLSAFAGIDPDRIPALEENGIRYLLLDLKDYLKVYRASSEDGYRKNVKNKQDAQKIELICSALEYEG